jgi:hypothetical protein
MPIADSRRACTRPAPAAVLRLGILLLALTGACSPSGNGSPAPARESPRPAGTALDAYEVLRREIYAGTFIALYDSCSLRYRDEKFPAEKYRKEAASSPGLKGLGLTSEDVARQAPREVVETYFRLLPEDVRKRIIVALSETKVVSQKALPDGRMAVGIESGGQASTLLWVMENGAWKMDGEEKGAGER